MNHPFVASHANVDICIRCKFPLIAHTNEAECEACGNKAAVKMRYGNMLMCSDCWQKELALKSEPMESGVTVNQSEDIQNKILAQSKEIDNSLELRTDIYNAETIAIVDIKKAVYEDENITNKPYVVAERLLERLTHFRKIGFELNEQIQNNNNQQRALQQELNSLSNTLRNEEREKLKLADINYKPNQIKSRAIKPISTTSTAKKAKIDKVALKKAAIELGISEFMIQQICVAKGLSVEDAVVVLKKSIEAAKSAAK